MKTLLVLRHAKSSWSDARLSDHDRPLNKRGRRDAPRMGELLRKEDLTPGIIITSSARRALDTAEAAAAECDFDGEIIVTRELYHADPEHYLWAAREYGDDHDIVMVVGHNPGIEDLVDQLANGWIRMPTAALAVFDLEIEEWSELDDDSNGRLGNVWLPRELW